MQVLAETVDSTALAKLSAELPKELKAAATPEVGHRTRDTSLGEFCYRVGEVAGIDESRQLPAYVHAVFEVLAKAVSEGELRPVITELSGEFQTLLPKHPDRADPEAFIARVQQHGSITGRE